MPMDAFARVSTRPHFPLQKPIDSAKGASIAVSIGTWELDVDIFVRPQKSPSFHLDFGRIALYLNLGAKGL